MDAALRWRHPAVTAIYDRTDMPADVSLLVALLLGIALSLLFTYLLRHPAIRDDTVATPRCDGCAPVDFKAMIERSPDTISRYDRDGSLCYANAAFRRLEPDTGEGGERYGGENFLPRLREVMESRREDEYECTWKTRAGWQTSLIRIAPEFDADGDVRGAISIGRDISALKETENRLRESRELLRELSVRREVEMRRVRKEAAREMHEDYGQRLSMLRMNLVLLQHQSVRDDPDGVARIGNSLHLLDETIAHMREIVSVIHPSVLNMAVAPALEWLAEEMLSGSGIRCEVMVTDAADGLDEMVTGLVYRLVQHALSNVVRHAQAQRVRIVLEGRGECLRLVVNDDGKGFDLNRERRDSLGLVAMEEIANMLHGEIVFLSTPHLGTEIEVCFPPQGTSAHRPAATV
ncbi:PAS domain-containing sensor histidine kinase [Sideroxyarcus sp. TK5]